MGFQQATFRDLIAANKRNSVLLVLAFTLFVAATAMVLTLAILACSGTVDLDRLNWLEAVAVGGCAALISFGLSMLGYYCGDDFVLAVAGAKPLQHRDDPELFNVVEEMAIAAGVPMPAVYLIRDPALNAFATGRDPKHAAVAITAGLRDRLTREELQGVIAHEMSHVRNYDIRLMLMMAVLVGTIVMLCDLFWQVLRWGPGPRSSRKRDKEGGGGGALALILIVLGVILAIVAPILAQIIQLAVSRQREYLADASAVELTRYPQGLATPCGKSRTILTSLTTPTAAWPICILPTPSRSSKPAPAPSSPAILRWKTASAAWKRWHGEPETVTVVYPESAGTVIRRP